MAEETEPSTLAELRRSRGAGKRRPAISPGGQPRTLSLFEDLVDLADLRSRSQPLPEPTSRTSLPTVAPEASPDHARPDKGTLTVAEPPLQRQEPSRPPLRVVEPGPRDAEENTATPASAPQIWSVSELVRHLRSAVERGYPAIAVEGEISNWRPSGSGHCYFTLKDANAQLSAVMFRRQASLLRFRPADGDAVRLWGQLSVYEGRGQMQLLVERMEQQGLGALLAAVQRLKEQLRREGVFDRKRALPTFPRCIGVVTSLRGAALRDIVKVCRRRHAAVQILVYPAAVQGPNCAVEIAAGLRWFSTHPGEAQVVLVARGGGSWEDLHGFDDERVARSIAGCALPVITGIGHATDSTIADAAADVCAPTPSAAAELLTAAQHRVEERLLRLEQRLHRAGHFEVLKARRSLAEVGAAGVLRRMEDLMNRRAQRLDDLQYRALAGVEGSMRRAGDRLRMADVRLGRGNPAVRLQGIRHRLERAGQWLERASGVQVQRGERRREAAETRLLALSPLRVLERGYALVYSDGGQLIQGPEDVQAGEPITARLARGAIRAVVAEESGGVGPDS